MLAATLAISGCEEAEPQARPAVPPSLPVAQVVTRSIEPFQEFTGYLEAVKTTELRPRVAGYVSGVRVPEGRIVRAGQVLFSIDARPYQAALDSAEAGLQEAQAAACLATTELARADSLFERGVSARERLDQASAAQQQAVARVAAAEASVAAARLNLSFTQVRAPISGRVGQVLVTEGNYVAAGTTTLTTIVSTNPLHVYFDVDEATYLEVLAGSGRAGRSPEVQIALATDETYTRRGSVNFVSNAVQRGTGTIRVRAVISDPNGRLTPGLFARVKLVTAPASPEVLVADQSIATDQGRRYVLVVDDEDVTQYRPVELGRVIDGLRIIEQGLEPGERIVVKGLARPGMTITPQRVSITGQPIGNAAPSSDASEGARP
jgi:gold/copper resistance efflux system membrane fusion protein